MSTIREYCAADHLMAADPGVRRCQDCDRPADVVWHFSDFDLACCCECAKRIAAGLVADSLPIADINAARHAENYWRRRFWQAIAYRLEREHRVK